MTTTIRQYTSALLLAAAIVPFMIGAAEAEEFLLGATVHFTQDKGILDVNLKLARDCNLNAIREDLPWKLAERRRGIVTAPSLFRRIADTARANGLPVLGILAYNNHFYDGGSYPRSAEAVAAYARYAGQVAAGLRGRGVPFYQVWNEWDGGCGMNPAKRGRGDAESYINLLKAAYPALKQADPNATVVSGSVCTGDEYFEKLLQLGMADHCDILSIHTYNFQQRGEAATPEAWQRRMLKLDEMIRKYNNGDSKPVFVTEMGYPSFTGPHGRTAGECAVYLARLMLLARTVPNLRGLWWYDLQDDGWDITEREHNFGLFNADGTPKPAAAVMRDLAPLVRKGEFLGRLDTGDPSVWILRFRHDGRETQAMWSTGGRRSGLVWEKGPGSTGTFEMRRPGQPPQPLAWGRRDWVADRKAKFDPARREITIDEMPLLMTGDFTDVRLAGTVERPAPPAGRSDYRLPPDIAVAVPKGEKAAAVSLPKRGNYFKFADPGYQGDKDLDAAFEFHYDRDHLYLTVRTVDDHFRLAPSAERGWGSDGIQTGFHFDREGGSPLERVELDFALTGHGPEACWRTPFAGRRPGIATDVKITVREEKREGTARWHTYRLTIPASSLGAGELRPGRSFLFSILVNDNDGAGRKGFLHWGGGLGSRPYDPSFYNLVVLK